MERPIVQCEKVNGIVNVVNDTSQLELELKHILTPQICHKL